jgi:hypothetical protein
MKYRVLSRLRSIQPECIFSHAAAKDFSVRAPRFLGIFQGAGLAKLNPLSAHALICVASNTST